MARDLRPGGGFEKQMREGSGDFQPHIDGCFLDVVPERCLVFTTALRAGWQPVDPWLALTAILTFEARDGGTLYSARVLHRSPQERRKHGESGLPEGRRTPLRPLAPPPPTN